MPRVETFEDLLIWRKGIELVKEIYSLTDQESMKRDYGLVGQLRRCAVSIPSNIAEGFERRSRKKYLNFLNMAKGSAGEVRTQIFIAKEIGYVSVEQHERVREMARFLSGSITNHMKAIASSERV